MENLFQVLLAVCHKLIQQILYTQWNGIVSHFYRFIFFTTTLLSETFTGQ